MARRATKDTFMYEAVGVDTFVRRQVFADQYVPDHYVVGEDTDESAVTDVESGPQTVGFGAAPPEYKHALEPAPSSGGRRARGGAGTSPAPAATTDTTPAAENG